MDIYLLSQSLQFYSTIFQKSENYLRVRGPDFGLFLHSPSLFLLFKLTDFVHS